MDTSDARIGTCRKCGRIIAGDLTECLDCDSDSDAAKATSGLPTSIPREPVWVEAPAVVDLDTRVLGCRVAGALIDLVPLTLLMLGFASMWLRLGKQADGSSELSLFGWAFVGCGGWNRGALVL